jgi:hypothetical protein
VAPSLDALSPAATVTVTPIAAAAMNARSIWFIACPVHVLSALPQLIETTDGRRLVSCTAVVTASMKP